MKSSKMRKCCDAYNKAIALSNRIQGLLFPINEPIFFSMSYNKEEMLEYRRKAVPIIKRLLLKYKKQRKIAKRSYFLTKHNFMPETYNIPTSA